MLLSLFSLYICPCVQSHTIHRYSECKYVLYTPSDGRLSLVGRFVGECVQHVQGECSLGGGGLLEHDDLLFIVIKLVIFVRI